MRLPTLALIFCVSTSTPMLANDIKSCVAHWDLLEATHDNDQLVRPILKGKTLDLEHLDVFAVSLATASQPIESLGSPDLETLFIVKEGNIRLTLDAQSSVLSPGSVAMLYPQSQYKIENADNVAATFYALRYASKAGLKKNPNEKGPGSFMVEWNSLEYMPSHIGGRRNNFDEPTAMMNRFELHTSTLNAGLTNHRAHTHRAEEMVLVLKGKVEMLIGEKRIVASEGDLYFIEANILHSLRNVGDTETEYFAFQWM